jgi:hypothetical protein
MPDGQSRIVGTFGRSSLWNSLDGYDGVQPGAAAAGTAAIPTSENAATTATVNLLKFDSIIFFLRQCELSILMQLWRNASAN